MSSDPAERDRRLATLLVRLGLATDGEVSRTAALEETLSRLSSLPPFDLLRRLEPESDVLRICSRCHDPYLHAPAEPGDPPGCPDCGPEPSSRHAATVLMGQDSGADETRILPPGSPAAPAPSPPSPGAPRALGRYVLLERLGLGGMGVVWKAWDPDLGRVVALKQIRKSADFGPEHVARFQREARLAAKLSHPNIVGIHDVGAVGEDHYITMEYVEGRTLAEFLDETREAKRKGARGGNGRLREEVRLLAEVAEAVAYAHREGVIHRDLKPGNVLLDRGGRPRVMDFGLAKEVETAPEDELAVSHPTLTVVGQVVGTPDYMSPEQAESDGGRIGPRSDVWALGVVLYEVLTGDLPFTGKRSWKTLLKVIREEAPRPRRRNPCAPIDLEAVCLKALEKGPERRYSGAGDFAEELRRWLRGEPVQARRHGVAYRLWRGALRHQRAVAAAAAALALVVWAAASWSIARTARERLLAGVRRAAGVSLQGALAVRRMGLLAAMETHRPALAAAVRDAEAALGGSSPEPAYCMGRFARAVMDDEDARGWQEQALAVDPEYAPALYETAVLAARAYGERRVRVRDVVRAERGAGTFAGGPTGSARQGDLREPTRAELEERDSTLREHKTRLTDSLAALQRLSRAGRTRAQGVGPAALACVEGLLAAHSGPDAYAAYPAARPHFEEALAADPLLEEAYEGLFEAAAVCARWDDAVDICTRGLEHDRGYLPHLLHRGAIRTQLGSEAMGTGRDGAEFFARAEEDFSRAIELDPRSVAAWTGRGTARLDAGVEGLLLGRDASEPLRRAVADFEQAIALDPVDASPWVGRANTRVNLARAHGEVAGGGGLADESLAGAVSDYGEALQRDPGCVEAWKNRGLARMSQADVSAARGGESGPLYQQALADFARAIELFPGDAGGWSFRAMAWRNWGLARRSRGEDADEAFEASARDFETVIALDSRDAESWQSLGKTRMNLGDGVRLRGGDPVPHYRAAVEACTHAVELNPRSVDAWLSLGAAQGNWGAYYTTRGQDPSEPFAAAAAAYGKALDLVPRHPSAWRGLGTLRTNWGAWRLKQGEDPTEQFESAVTAYEKGLEIDPDATEPLLSRALMRTNWGIWLERRNEDPAGQYSAAVADLDRALARNRELAEAWFSRGRARMRWGCDGAKRGQDPRELFEAAVADFDGFLQRVPGHSQAAGWREQLRTWLAQMAPAASPEWVDILSRANAALAAGQPVSARSFLETGLAAAPSGPTDMPEHEREIVAGAHYHLACILALEASVGASEEARTAAFHHLDRSVDFGWKDASQAAQDPDLAGLREDPRWPATLDRMR